jgi:hypothetical protein
VHDPVTPHSSSSPRRPDTNVSVRSDEIVGFALVAMTVILFMAWPRRVSYEKNLTWRRDPRGRGEGPAHPYRRAAPRAPRGRAWTWHDRGDRS